MATGTVVEIGKRTFTATAVAIGAFLRVAHDSSGTISLAGATDAWIGTTEAPCAASAQDVTVALRGKPGTMKMIANGVVAVNAPLYAGASGKVSATANAFPTGFIALEAASADGDQIECLRNPSGASNGGGTDVLRFPVNLASITGSGDVWSNEPLTRGGVILSTYFNVTVPATTGSKLATLNLEINTTNLTGGEVALTSANCTPLGAIVAGAAVTGANTFSAGDTLSIESSGVTAFVEGAGVLSVVVQYNT